MWATFSRGPIPISANRCWDDSQRIRRWQCHSHSIYSISKHFIALAATISVEFIEYTYTIYIHIGFALVNEMKWTVDLYLCVSSDCASFIVRFLVHLLCCLTDEWRDDRELRRSSQYRTEWQQWTSMIHFQRRLLYIFSTFSLFLRFCCCCCLCVVQCNRHSLRLLVQRNNIENVINNNRAMGTN